MGKTHRYTAPGYEPTANEESFRADIERRRSNAGTPRPGKKNNHPPRKAKHSGKGYDSE